MIRSHVLLCLVCVLCAGAAEAQRLQGYVSGNLLSAWCEGRTPLDTEACLSYLRGVFDTLQVMQSRSADDDADGGTTAICIPKEVPVTQLQVVSKQYTANHPGVLHGQGAAILLDAFLEAFPCRPGSGREM